MARTGSWIHLGYRWHAYSYAFETALDRDAARDAYLERAASSFFVYFESADLLFDCFGNASPLFDDWRDDLYVFPADLAWTMVFTHEQESGLGPDEPVETVVTALAAANGVATPSPRISTVVVGRTVRSPRCSRWRRPSFDASSAWSRPRCIAIAGASS
jgi:hypothetical protein